MRGSHPSNTTFKTVFNLTPPRADSSRDSKPR